MSTNAEIGTVEEGLKEEKIDSLKQFDSIDNPECEACEISEYCTEQSCVMQNLTVMGDINKPIPVMCKLRKLIYEIYTQNEDLIKRIVM